MSVQTSREALFDPGCVWIASRSRVGREREKIRENKREENSVNIEEKSLNRVCSFVRRKKVHLFPHAI